MQFAETINHQEFLEQLQLIQDLSADEAKDINKLYFQELVLESLSPEEQDAYMRFLLEPRAKNSSDIPKQEEFEHFQHPGHQSFLNRLKETTRNWAKLASVF